MNNFFVLTNPLPVSNKSPLISLGKFCLMLANVFCKPIVLGGNLEELSTNSKVEIHSVKCKRTGSMVGKILSFLKLELLLFFHILRRADRTDKMFFWIADKMLFPFWAAKLKRVQTYYFLMGNVGIEGKRTLFGLISEQIILYMAKRADYVCVESLAVIKQWKIKVSPQKLKIIHLFVEDEAKGFYEQKEDIVGMVCRLVEGKHVLASIEAFSMFKKLNPGWKLQIVGSGKLRADCETMIGRLMVNDVELLGWVEHSQLPDIVAKWKLLLFPTDAEGLPNGLIETMLQGVPAVASPVGGIIDVIEDGVNGWILPDSSAGGIFQTMIQAVSSQDLMSVAKAAEDTVAHKFTFKASISNLKEQLKEVRA